MTDRDTEFFERVGADVVERDRIADDHAVHIAKHNSILKSAAFVADNPGLIEAWKQVKRALER